MEEKRYLKWYNKIGYGSGDIAGNVVYSFLSSFVMIYLTNTVGLNAGIVGTLMAISKLFDGITDIFFGSLIDRTKSKLGKARPWMLYGFIGCAATLVAIFAIPTGMGEFGQYACFFVAYTSLNAIFYTANNIAYSALTALVTKNGSERVEMGAYRFVFAFSTNLLIQTFTLKLVDGFGGGAIGWKTVAIIYAIIGIIVNTLSVFSVKELTEEELNENHVQSENERHGLLDVAKLLVSNKYYLMICTTYILQYIYIALINMGLYFMTYVLFNEDLYPAFSWAVNIPFIVSMVITPKLVAKMNGMYKINFIGYVIGSIGRVLVMVAAYLSNVPMMLVFTAVAALGMGPWTSDSNAVIAACAEHTYLTTGKRVDGAMYSCTSLGVKVGGGLGTAIAGWLLAFSGFDETLMIQSETCVQMLYVMYLILPAIITIMITFIMSKMNVEKANAELMHSVK